MSIEALLYLQTAEARQLIEENLETDPSVLALRVRNADLATQLKYLQRARKKLPSWYAARAVVPPLAFEQCSSEAAARAKDLRGKTCLDLTCGLGVDAHYFSQQFESVVALERNAILAETVRYNFALMDVKNVEIINDTAENYLKTASNQAFDWIFLDPARRDDKGKKVFLPEDCEPNLVELLPELRRVGQRIWVKMSPLYDIDAAFRQFPDVDSVGVLSVDGECKEVWLIFDGTRTKNVLVKIMDGRDAFFYRYDADAKTAPRAPTPPPQYQPQCIIEPDVAFYKARLVTHFAEFLGIKNAFLNDSTGFWMSDGAPEGSVPARVFEVLADFDYQPKQIAQFLKKQSIKRLNVVQRQFPFSAQQVRDALKVQEGGDLFLICTQMLGAKKAFLARKLA